MAKNIEIKARHKDFDAFYKKLSELPHRYEGLDVQVDTFFESKSGRLKLRESSLNGAFLIPYLRPDSKGPKESDYALIKVENPSKLKELLNEILGIKTVVKKERQIYHYQNVRIHYDHVEGLGSFIELEAVVENPDEVEKNIKKVQQLLQFFGIKEEDMIAGAYADMQEHSFVN